MQLVRKYFVHGLVASILLGLLFAFLGVYDTNRQPFFHRTIFWTSTMVVGIFTTAITAPWVMNRWLPDLHRYLQLFILALIISVPVTLVLAGYDHKKGADWTITIWLLQYRYVMVISLILLYGSYFVLKAQGRLDTIPPDVVKEEDEPTEVTSSDPESATKPPSLNFMQRLPEAYHQAQLYGISSEDHYLKVYTSLGDELILMRLSDALKELESVPGMQTHRSWWVAKDAVTEMQRKQGKSTLQLKSGISVPVSRTFEKAVRETFL